MEWAPAREDRQEIKQCFSQLMIPSFSKPLLPSRSHLPDYALSAFTAGPFFQAWNAAGLQGVAQMSSLSTQALLPPHFWIWPWLLSSTLGSSSHLLTLLSLSSFPVQNQSLDSTHKILCLLGLPHHSTWQHHSPSCPGLPPWCCCQLLFLWDPVFIKPLPPSKYFGSTFKIHPESSHFFPPFSCQPGPGQAFFPAHHLQQPPRVPLPRAWHALHSSSSSQRLQFHWRINLITSLLCSKPSNDFLSFLEQKQKPNLYGLQDLTHPGLAWPLLFMSHPPFPAYSPYSGWVRGAALHFPKESMQFSGSVPAMPSTQKVLLVSFTVCFLFLS